MLIVIHNTQRVLRIERDNQLIEYVNLNASIAEVLSALSEQFPQSLLVWCRVEAVHEINKSALSQLLRLPQEIISFQPQYGGYFGAAIEWVDESNFVAVPKHTRYATWMISSGIGAIHASLWAQFKPLINPKYSFDYTLHAIGKQLQSRGILCYSEPKLFLHQPTFVESKASRKELYQFVKQHYKGVWVWLLFWQQLLHQEGVGLVALAGTFFVKRKKIIVPPFIQAPSIVKIPVAISVLIPTLNRPDYLLDFLTDLQAQTLLPKEVIVIEQNADQGSSSQLLEMLSKPWSFKVKHLFINQLGVCNARNLGLAQVTGDWVFFADDDIRIAPDFLEKCWDKITQNQAQAVSVACLNPTQLPEEQAVIQWNAFGGGSSLVAKVALASCSFSMVFENGFGEDLDFGRQLRQAGTDVLYLATPAITHLKAPSGGFRSPKKRAWEIDPIQPKPAPTVMAYIQKQYTPRQQKTYKLLLLLRYYKHQTIKNPFRYYVRFQQQWKQSVAWALKLEAQS